MRIAIDLTPIPRQLTGVGKYVLCLLNSLAEFDKVNQYWIFVKKDQREIFDPNRDNFHIVCLSEFLHNRMMRIAWEQAIFPIHLLSRGIELLHSVHYTTPFLAPCKCVVTYHDMTHFIYPEKHTLLRRIFFRSFILFSIKKASRIIADSENTKWDIHKILDFFPKEMDVVHLAVDPKYHPLENKEAIQSVKKKYGIEDGFILYVGTLEPRKNIARLIQAYERLILDNKIGHQLVIAGKKGWGYKDIYDLANHLEGRVKNKIQFTGYVPETDLPFLYNAADLFVYPSLYEGFGIPTLEAMACGVPVVSSNVSSLPEVVGDAGILVDPNDIDAISQAIFAVLADQSLKSELQIRGLQRALKFSMEKMAQGILMTYNKALKINNYND